GLYHCGYARERINEEIMRCRRDGSSFSIIFIDLDHFKEVNDRYGHLIGDKVIRHVAAVLQSSVRRGDILSRYGGDEFLLLLPGTESKDAELTLQRLLRAVQSHPYYVNGLPLHLGLSGGTAEYPCEGQNPEQLLQVADQKMYCKKS
ncbi:MAG: GGDEF domain-containing protein, partial [Dethiobacteria bacterium]